MTTSEPNEQPPIPSSAQGADPDETKTLEVRPEAPAPDPPPMVVEQPAATAEEAIEERNMVVGAPVARPEPETVYVPLAVSIGDGFKFGCGFFLALVIAMLVGFVLIALLFVLSSLIGLNLPISR